MPFHPSDAALGGAYRTVVLHLYREMQRHRRRGRDAPPHLAVIHRDLAGHLEAQLRWLLAIRREARTPALPPALSPDAAARDGQALAALRAWVGAAPRRGATVTLFSPWGDAYVVSGTADPRKCGTMRSPRLDLAVADVLAQLRAAGEP